MDLQPFPTVVFEFFYVDPIDPISFSCLHVFEQGKNVR